MQIAEAESGPPPPDLQGTQTMPDPLTTPLPTLADLAAGRVRAGLTMKTWWWEALAPEAPVPLPPHPVDVAIIGSGFTGLVAALTLLRAGRSVLVLEAGRPGFGASTRNGGQIGSGNQKFRVKTLIAMQGQAKAEALLREGVAMLDHIEALIRDEGIACHFARTGRFRGAMRPAHYEAMARDMEDLQRHAGVASFMIPRAEQHREIASDRFFGGSVLPDDASLHPGLYHTGLLDRVRAAGGIVAGQAEVVAINAESPGFSLVTPRGKITAREVVVATNGYTQHFDRYTRRRIVPVGSALIATGAMAPERITALMPGGRMYGNTARVFSYFRAAPDAPRLIWGGRIGHNAPQTDPRAYAHLARDLLETFPQMADAPVSHAWSGRIGYTFDEFPHLGRTPAGIHYAMGYCGTGVSRATWFGRKIAQQLMGDPAGASAFSDLRFPSHPFAAVAPMTVPFFEHWYRLRDRFDF